MKKKDNKSQKLSPKDYRDILKHVQLELIVLESSSSKVKRDKFGKKMKNIIKDKVSYKSLDENQVIFNHQYDLISTQTTQKEFALKITCTFSAIFSSDTSLPDEFLEIFSSINIHINTWPYFREFVQSITQRMGLPPMTLPLIKRG